MRTAGVSPAQRKRAAVFSICPIVLCAVLFLCRGEIADFAHSGMFPDCQFHEITGWLCPACGNTRAVLAILEGHFLRAFGYNPMIPVLVIALLCLYLEQLCLVCGKRIRLLPRRNALLFTVVGVVLGYDIIRNFFPQITLCLA